MFKNKKSSVGNQIFSFAILIIALFVLITAFVRLTIKYNIKDEKGNSRVIGDTQLKLIETYAKGEIILLYLDQSAKYSLEQAFYRLAYNGGIQGDSECGKYQDYNLWNKEDKECYPENYKTDFESLFRNYLRLYLRQYPLADLSQNAYENNYNLIFNYGSIEAVGKAKNTFEMQMMQEGYDISISDEEIDLGFEETETEDTTKPEEEIEIKPIQPTEPETNIPADLGSGLCSGSLVSTGYSCWGGCKLKESVIPQLRKAEQIATDRGLKLEVYSAWRSQEHQEELWNKNGRNCARVCCPGNDNFAHCPHVNGCAVDVKLSGKNMGDPNNQRLLEQIMCEAGWVRYTAEYWHFEYGTVRWQRGSSQGACAS